jgi:hypothetical protein
VVDTTESVGLTGRSTGEEAPITATLGVAAIGESALPLRGSRGGVWGRMRDELEPLMVASLRRRSSKGAPVTLWSALGTRLNSEGLSKGVPNTDGLRAFE